jgi:tetratricopeptide (TPR) repeat protein
VAEKPNEDPDRGCCFSTARSDGNIYLTRAEVYRNEETLWEDNLSKNPDAWQAHNRLGQRFFNQEKYVEAAPHFELAARLKPELADNYNQLGLVYCRLGRFEEGIAEYRKGLRLKEAKSSTANDAGTAKMEANLANALTITAIHMTETAQTSPNTSAIAAAQADEGKGAAMAKRSKHTKKRWNWIHASRLFIEISEFSWFGSGDMTKRSFICARRCNSCS